MRSFRVVNRIDVLPKRLDRYRSFPGLVQTGPGSILMGYRDGRSMPNTFSHGAEGDFMLIRCQGGGWGDPELLYRHQGQIEEMGCGDLTRVRDGTILLFSRQWDGAHKRTHGVYIAQSTDGGKSFRPRKAVSLPMFPNGWAPYGKIIEMPDGLWLLGGYGVRPGEQGFSAACLASHDRGESWHLKSWIAECGCLDEEFARKRGFPEPFLLLLPGGRLHALLRTNGTFFATFSDDGGRMWRPPTRSFQGMASAGIVLATGEMLISYRGTSHEMHIPGQRVPTVKQRKGRLYCFRTSSDGGASWSEEGVLDDGEAYQVGSFGMGDVLGLPDGRVLAVYYTSDRDQAPWIEQAILARE